jgi:hypothetical protein
MLCARTPSWASGCTVTTGNFTGNVAWEPIGTVVLEPNCGVAGYQTSEWSYAVSAPGYAIASGQVTLQNPVIKDLVYAVAVTLIAALSVALISSVRKRMRGRTLRTP